MNHASAGDLVSLRDDIRDGKTSALAALDGYLARIDKQNPRLNAFHEVFADEARTAAAATDQALAAGNPVGPLAGVPIAVKDNIVTRIGRTTCSSRILENYRSPFDATVIDRLTTAGAILIGKTNMDEFAMGSSCETCAWGAVRNPWDTSAVPGGSSGGSAAAVAANLCAAALGSDTGGSIRQPAALCGIVGFKPSFGRISRYGLVAFGSSLDQIGPLTHSVRDAALLYQCMAGDDVHDSTCAPRPVEAVATTLEETPRSFRVGLPVQYRKGNAPAVDAAVNRAIEHFKSMGAEIVEIELPLTDVGISTYYVIAPAEACSNLARFDGIRYGHRTKAKSAVELFDLYAQSRAEGFGSEVQRRIMLGTYVLSAGYYDAYYRRALQIRRLIKQEFDRAFEKCDVILGPTSPTAAFSIGGLTDPLAMYMCDVYTVNTNIAGICGISLPAGFDESSGRQLPVGIQLQAQAFEESLLLKIARAYERAQGPRAHLPTTAA
ncbi:MAG: Asp-tRNA(Asn)/Glu-tRNA(Gln) amidotransferase subunit GatA [Phycisphaerales bacterium]|nr:Asp-tRNA(Asn)/Glu-tRNA(Gln) amidotransferase subunit GatA [Phycisphaerales bacterium]